MLNIFCFTAFSKLFDLLPSSRHCERSKVIQNKSNSKPWVFIGTVILGSIFLTACGQKGPLYLPTKPAPHITPPIHPVPQQRPQPLEQQATS